MDDKPAQAPLADASYPAYMRPAKVRRQPIWRTILAIVVVIAIAALAAFGLKQCAGGTSAGRGRRPPTTVGVARAEVGQVPIQLDALGTVTPMATVNVTSRIAGTLDRVQFKEGQMVRAGALLAQVDPRPYQIALQQAQGQLARDEAALTNSQLLLSRDETLLTQDSIARQDVDTQRATVKQNEGVVKSDQAGVASARLNLVYTRITAPVSGRVGLRQVDVGNYVTAGAGTAIAVITQIDPIDVLFTLPQDDIPQVSARIRQGARLPVTAMDRSGGQILAHGMLSTLDNQVDVTTGTVKAKARFANRDGALFANQFVNTRVLVDTQQNVVVAPSSALRHGSQGDFVWVLTPQKTAHMQPVKTGPGSGEQTSFLSGLQAGQTVITEGGDRLREGAPVVLPGQRPTAGGVGGAGGRHGGRRGGRRPGGGAPGGGGGG